MNKYLRFRILSESSETSRIKRFIERLLVVFIPKANPDYDHLYQHVETWLIEYDDMQKITSREIGLNKEGEVLVIGPNERNMGFWTDNDLSLEDYADFKPNIISKENFDQLWNTYIKHQH